MTASASVKGERRTNSLWWPGRGQGRRILAFILTLDAVPATTTIGLERRSEFFSELRSIVWKNCLALLNDPRSHVASITLDGNLQVPPTMYSAWQCTMVSSSNSSLAGRGGAPNHSIGRRQAATNGPRGLPRMRTALPDLSIVLPGAQHPIQPHCQLMGASHLGYAVMLVHRQAQILPMPTRIMPLSLDRRLHQQPAKQRIALLGDVAHALLVLAAGGLCRNQSQIAAHLLASREASPVSQDQHVG